MDTTHPLFRANWIWPVQFKLGLNLFAQFRYDFSVNRLPAKAPLYVSADQCYMLYVNGKYVARGPARGYQRFWPYDEVDISSCLTKGHNWISVRGYNAGVSTWQYVHQGLAGFICAAEWPDVEIHSGPNWQMRIAPGYHRDTDRLSFQQNFQEWADARLDDQAWITSARRPSWPRWGGEENLLNVPFGSMPWHEMEPRRLPNLTRNVLAYRHACFTASGLCAKSWRDAKNLYCPLHSELGKIRWTQADKGRSSKGGLSLQLPKTGPGRFAAVSADMNRPVLGDLIVEAEGASGGETIDFFFVEGLRNNGCPIMGDKVTSGCEVALVARLEVKPGRTRHEFFQMIGHRYVVAVVRESRRPIRLRLAVRETVYPLETSGGFECDNKEINDIYRISVQTQRVCAIDAYVDTPWREQAQWWGDTRVQAQNTFHISGDTRLLERGIRSIAQQSVPNGLTYGHAPTMAHSCILPDFSIIWVLTVWDHYYQTGKTDVFVEQWHRIQRILDYFRSEGRSSNGLLAFDRRYWLFLDWADTFSEGTPTVLNLWYLYMLEKLIELAGRAGMRREKDKLQGMYDKQRRLTEKYLWDAKKRLFCDGLKNNGNKVATCSIHTQVLAILCGLKKRYHPHLATSRLLPYLRGCKVSGPLPSSYWVTYVYDVTETLGYGREVVAHIRENWRDMIPSGGTWEMFPCKNDRNSRNVHTPGETSMTHAWAAHPIYHLTRNIGGIIQADVGWRRIVFRPLLDIGEIRLAKVVIPTPLGKIRASWRRMKNDTFEVKLFLPKGVEAKVYLPDKDPATITGRNSWSVEP